MHGTKICSVCNSKGVATEEWLIEIRYVTRVKQQISSENYLQCIDSEWE